MSNQNLNNVTGSQPASAAPDGFETMDDWTAPGRDQEGAPEVTLDVPEDLLTTEEPAPETPPADAGAEEMEWEVDGQKVTAAEIAEYMATKDQNSTMLQEFQQLRGDFDAMQAESRGLEPYKEMKTFFERNPDIRRKLEGEIGGLDQLADKNVSDDPHVAQLQQQVRELSQFKKEAEITHAEGEVNAIFAALAKEHPDIVDDNFRQGVLNQVFGAFKGDPRFGAKTLAAAAKATAFIMQKATEKATQNGTSAALRAIKQPGVVRLVPSGTKRDAQTISRDPLKMSHSEVLDAFANEVGSGAA